MFLISPVQRRTQISNMADIGGQPLGRPTGLPFALCPFKQITKVLGMASCNPLGLPALDELFARVGACGLVQPIMPNRASALEGDKRLCDEVRQGADLLRCRDLAPRPPHPRRLCRKIASEYGEPSHDHALELGQQL